MPGTYLEHLSWPEAEALLGDGKVVLLPLGARLKEHGRHLPLNNDWLIAEYLARRVAEQCDVIVLPTLQHGYYPAFTEYPGSVSLRPETCRDTLVDICRSLHTHGANTFYVLNTGISTLVPLRMAQEQLASETLRFEFTDIQTAYAHLRQKLETQARGTHADELETSTMLYIAPEVVRMGRAAPDMHDDLGPGGLTRNRNKGTGIYSPTGAYGDPTLATKDKGAAYVEGIVQYLVNTLRALAPAPTS